MRQWIQQLTPKKVLAAVLIVALAFLAEWGFVALSRGGAEYDRAEYAAGDFSYWEMEPQADGRYYMLAYNSYFYIEDLGGLPVGAVDIYLTRPDEDMTECVVRYTGTKNGIAGEFVAPLTKVTEGLYSATLDIESLDMLKIYPTERVRTTLAFEGAVFNPAVASTSYSFARIILWGFLLTSLYILYILIRAALKKEKAPVSGWVSIYVLVTAACLLVVLLATNIFSAARGLHGLLLPVAWVGISLLFAVVWLVTQKIDKLPLKAAVMVLALGALMSFATAPLQVPDEYAHFMRAYAISQGDFTFNEDRYFPGDVDHLMQTFPPEFYSSVQQAGNGNALARIIYYQSIYDTPFTGKPTTSYIQSILPYLPSALVIAVVRLLGGNALMCLYAGRLCHVALLALCVYFALKWAVRYRGAMIFTALLPLTMFMASSMSYDAIFFCGLMLFLGVLFKNDIGWRDLAVAMVAFGFMISIRPVYLPLALLIFTIPKEQLKIKPGRMPTMLLVLAAGIALWLFTLQIANWARGNITSLPQQEGVNVQAQVLYVLKNPLRYIMVMLVDGYMNLFYLSGFGLFGWLDVPAPLTGLLTPILLVLVAALYADDARLYPRRDTALSAVVLILNYVVIVTGFYCAWSSLGSTTILGVQTRYFIPLLPCLIALLSRALSPVLQFRSIKSASADRRDRITLYLTGCLTLIAAGEIAVTYFLR